MPQIPTPDPDAQQRLKAIKAALGDPGATAHELLGLQPGHSEQERAKAIKLAITTHHPDKGGDAESFMRIMSARRTISDERQRSIDKQATEERQMQRRLLGRAASENESRTFDDPHERARRHRESGMRPQATARHTPTTTRHESGTGEATRPSPNQGKAASRHRTPDERLQATLERSFEKVEAKNKGKLLIGMVIITAMAGGGALLMNNPKQPQEVAINEPELGNAQDPQAACTTNEMRKAAQMVSRIDQLDWQNARALDEISIQATRISNGRLDRAGESEALGRIQRARADAAAATEEAATIREKLKGSPCRRNP